MEPSKPVDINSIAGADTVRYININGKSVPVTAAPNINLDDAVSSVLFKDWYNAIEEGLHIRGIFVQSLDKFGSVVGFLKIETDAVDNQGNFIPGICFLRGDSVAILVLLECSESEKKFVVLVSQARMPVGKASFIELPAGMLDGKGNLTGKAVDEIKEELGMNITASELILLHKDKVALSPGGCNEHVIFYLVKKTLSRDEIDELNGKQTGVEAEGEHIRVVVVPIEEINRYFSDGKVLMALGLYGEFQKASE